MLGELPVVNVSRCDDALVENLRIPLEPLASVPGVGQVKVKGFLHVQEM